MSAAAPLLCADALLAPAAGAAFTTLLASLIEYDAAGRQPLLHDEIVVFRRLLCASPEQPAPSHNQPHHR